MTKFGQGGGRNGAKPGAFSDQSSSAEQPGARPSGDADREERISVKDNRRIDPKTGQVRQAAGDGAAGGSAPGGASAAAGEGSVTPGETTETGAGAAELAAARAEVAERTADLQRITAEYANYRKRADRDKQAAAAAGKAAVVGGLLAVLDDLDRAEEHGDLTGSFKTIADKLTGILERAGLSQYGAPGDEFDPNIHEAVQFATSADVDHPTVTTVLRLGYLFEERVLRPAVVVVTGPEHEVGGGDGGSEPDVGHTGDLDPALVDPAAVDDAAVDGAAADGAATDGAE